MIILLGIAGYIYADSRLKGMEIKFATSASVEQLEGSLSHKIDSGFRSLTARMNLSDVQGVVRDIQDQIRQKEREIADLDMVIAEIDGNSDSASLLRARAFSLRQELTELKSRLTAEQTSLAEARRSYQQALVP